MIDGIIFFRIAYNIPMMILSFIVMGIFLNLNDSVTLLAMGKINFAEKSYL